MVVDAQQLSCFCPLWRYQKRRFLGLFLKVGTFTPTLRFGKLTVAQKGGELTA